MKGNSEPPAQGAAPKTGRWKKLLQNLALMFGAFGFCVLALEILLRLLGFGNVEIYQADPVVYWKLSPSQDCYTKENHKPVHINAHGTRGPDFPTVKPPGTLRILSLGDSRTFGWGVSDTETYSSQLQRMLQEQLASGKKVEVINAGVNAWSYSQMDAYFRHIGVQYQPDIVILASANLWTQFTNNNSPAFVRQFLWRVRVKNFARRFAIYHFVVEVGLRNFYQRNKVKFIPVDPGQDALFKEQQQKDPDALFRSAIDSFCAAALSNGVKPFLLDLPTEIEMRETGHSNMLSVKTEISQRRHIPLIDLSPEVKGAAGRTLYLEGDPVHFTAEGNAVIARALCNVIMNSTVP